MQLRDKRGSAREFYAQAKELQALLAPRGVRFIVNDRPDIAAMAGAGGVHVGQEDLPVEEARRICGPSRWVGVSTHNLEQLREADLTSADYIAVGPIFPTGTKENPDPVVGLEFLRAARQLTRETACGDWRHHDRVGRGRVSRRSGFGGGDSRSCLLRPIQAHEQGSTWR